jgi:hypothetical protein
MRIAWMSVAADGEGRARRSPAFCVEKSHNHARVAPLHRRRALGRLRLVSGVVVEVDTAPPGCGGTQRVPFGGDEQAS